jgi:hypothetical protein
MGQFGWLDETQVSSKRKPRELEAGASTQLFPSENWSSVWRNTSCKTEVSWWIKAHFFPKRPLQLRGRSTCVSRTQGFLLDAVASSHCFPVRMVVVLAKVLPATLMFQSEYRLSLIQIGLFSSGEETHAPLQRQACMLERAASSILFSIVNWGRFWEEHFLQNIDFKVEKGWFWSK